MKLKQGLNEIRNVEDKQNVGVCLDYVLAFSDQTWLTTLWANGTSDEALVYAHEASVRELSRSKLTVMAIVCRTSDEC